MEPIASVTEEDGLASIAVVGPEVESKNSEKIGAIFDFVDPGVRNHLIGALLAIGYDDFGCKMETRKGSNSRTLAFEEPHMWVAIDEFSGNVDGDPCGSRQAHYSNQLRTDDLVCEALMSRKPMEFNDVELAI